MCEEMKCEDCGSVDCDGLKNCPLCKEDMGCCDNECRWCADGNEDPYGFDDSHRVDASTHEDESLYVNEPSADNSSFNSPPSNQFKKLLKIIGYG